MPIKSQTRRQRLQPNAGRAVAARLPQWLAAEFWKMRLRSRIAICTRLIIAVVMVIAGLAQIAATSIQEKGVEPFF